MNAYAVSSGSYSDYSVHCIFQDRVDAIRYAARLNGLSEEDQTYLEDADALPYAQSVDERRADRYRELDKRRGYNAAYVEEFDFYPSGVVPVN